MMLMDDKAVTLLRFFVMMAGFMELYRVRVLLFLCIHGTNKELRISNEISVTAAIPR